MASYLRVRTNGLSETTGYLIYFSSVDEIDEQLGVQTFDLSLPQSTQRLLTPTTGKQDDFNVQCKFIDNGTNKGISIDNVGNQTNLGIITTKEQINFIRDYIISNKIVAVYELYIEWMDKTFRGNALINHKVSSDSNFSFFVCNINFKIGGNVFGV